MSRPRRHRPERATGSRESRRPTSVRRGPPPGQPGLRDYFVVCGPGLEDVVSQELAEVGARDLRQLKGGVWFRGERKVAMAANLWLRSALRVMEPLLRAPASTPEELYRHAATVPWEEIIDPDQTLAVDATVRDSEIRHSKYAALKVKDAIVDRFRQRTGRRPDVDPKRPDLPVKLVIRRDVAELYRNLSGGSLHKRGWRPIQVKSPLNEALAAGLLRLTGWNGTVPLVDPFCGSGTFVIEAALLASRRPPGLGRRFAFERWREHDARTWKGLRDEAQSGIATTLDVPLLGSDRHRGAIEIARKSATAAGVDHLVEFRSCAVSDLDSPSVPGVLVTNPPYGERIGEGSDLIDSWHALGRFLHERFRGGTAFVLSGNAALTKHLGLRASQKWPVMNGPISCRWIRYDIHAADQPSS